MAELAIAPRELVLTSKPDPRAGWLSGLWLHREMLAILTRKDFQTRYKRASLGVLWAVAVPLLQAVVLAVVFSRVVRIASGSHYAIYVMSGVVAFSYFAAALAPGSTAIVDSSTLTDKVWFPRAILVVVPCISGLVGFAVTLVAVVVCMPIFGAPFSAKILLLIPASLLLIIFTTALSLVLAALYVYFRDVKYLVQASLLVWIYVTPVIYPQNQLGRFSSVVDANPLTGIVDLFHEATVGQAPGLGIAVLVSVLVTITLAVIGIEVQRSYDRLFVDLL